LCLAEPDEGTATAASLCCAHEKIKVYNLIEI
jgi:hypothetical protein